MHICRPTSARGPSHLPRRSKLPRAAILAGTPVADALGEAAKHSLVDAGFSRVDYFALVDAATLEPLDDAGTATCA